MAQLTVEQVSLLRRFATEEAARTGQGRRWLELLRSHEQELFQRYAASPTLRQRADEALGEAAALIKSLDSDQPRLVDDTTTTAVQAVLTELDTRASTKLRRASDTIRRDLNAARVRPSARSLAPAHLTTNTRPGVSPGASPPAATR